MVRRKRNSENEKVWLKLIDSGETKGKKFFGIVQYFHRQIGFITPDEVKADIFFRYDQIEPDKEEEYKSVSGLNKNSKADRVMFEVDLFEGRPVAKNIKVFKTPDEEKLEMERVVNYNTEFYNKGK